jgi:hypothetical protein
MCPVVFSMAAKEPRPSASSLCSRRYSGRIFATELYRDAGLVDVEVMVHAAAYPVGHSRRTVIPDLVRSLRPVIAGLGLASEHELTELDREVRLHLAGPRTLMMPHLLIARPGAASQDHAEAMLASHADRGTLVDAGNLHSAASRRAGARRRLGRENAAGRCRVARSVVSQVHHVG